MKRGWIRAAAMLLVSVLLVNVTWYWWRAEKYRPYTAGMEPQVFYTALDPSYYAVDAEGYTFSVAYPGYLSATGNLCVGGGYDYGLLLYEGENGYQIMVDSRGHALDSAFEPVVQAHAPSAAKLFGKAHAWWDLSG